MRLCGAIGRFPQRALRTPTVVWLGRRELDVGDIPNDLPFLLSTVG